MIKISDYDPKQPQDRATVNQLDNNRLQDPELQPNPQEQILRVDSSVVKKLNQLQPATNEALRVYITGGGCSGFKYCFKLDDTKDTDDTVVDISKSYQVVVDSMSISFLEGSMLMWKEDLDGARFLIENPNAETTCSCGASFALA